MENIDLSRYEAYKQEYVNGSRNPLDTVAHWSRSNPLNIFPIGILIATLLGLALLLIR
jgi:hypothetical protein